MRVAPNKQWSEEDFEMSSIAHISLAQYELMGEHGIFVGPHYQRVELIRGRSG